MRPMATSDINHMYILHSIAIPSYYVFHGCTMDVKAHKYQTRLVITPDSACFCFHSPMQLLVVDKYQTKKCTSLEKIVHMNLNIPHIQRNLDEERIQEIIEFQCRHFSRHKTLCFLGDIFVYTISQDARDIEDGEKCMIIDGMHRYFAMKSPRVYELMPTYSVSINIINGASGLSLQEAFLLINKAQPVPQYVIETSLEMSKRFLLEDIKKRLACDFKHFLSKSNNPRAPNFNLDIFTDSLIRSHALTKLSTSDTLYGYIKYVNMKLSHASTCTPKLRTNIKAKCEKHGIAYGPYFSCDVHYDWMENRTWIHEYLSEKEHHHASSHSSGGQTTPKWRMTQVERHKLWSDHYGKSMDATCKLCEMNNISVSQFDAGHVLSRKDGGSNMLENLVPICRACNLAMGTENMLDFARRINKDIHGICDLMAKK